MALYSHIVAIVCTPYRKLLSPYATAAKKQPSAPAINKKRKRNGTDHLPQSSKKRQRTDARFQTPRKQIIRNEPWSATSASPDSSSDTGFERQHSPEDVSTLDETSFFVDDVIESIEGSETTSQAVKILAIATNGSPGSKHVLKRLETEGWDNEHIMLCRHIIYRGYEQVFPISWKMPFRYMPESLFATSDTALLAMRNSQQTHGEVAFDRLMRLSGMLKSSIKQDGSSDGEKYTKRLLTAYIRALTKDTGLHKPRIVPLVKVIVGSDATDGKVIAKRAQLSLNNLAGRWERAFKEAKVARPVPDLYAIVGSGTTIVVAARIRDDPLGNLALVAKLDFEDSSNDFWSILALAMVVCHCRDQQIALAEATGIGKRRSSDTDPPEEDL